ncbi:MAG: hypothetical protein KDI44_13465 [Thiothrix sp.]|nr:hypothetical protein [Thiothrix sp.]
MGYRQAEFMRTLPAALHGYPYVLEDSRVRVQLPSGELLIMLGAEQQRRIALLCLPWLLVTFDYGTIPEPEFRVFLQQFDLYFRKGGG